MAPVHTEAIRTSDAWAFAISGAGRPGRSRPGRRGSLARPRRRRDYQQVGGLLERPVRTEAQPVGADQLPLAVHGHDRHPDAGALLGNPGENLEWPDDVELVNAVKARIAMENASMERARP